MDQLKGFRPILALFAIFVGYTLLEVADETEQRVGVMHPDPQPISCRDLIDHGPPANRHIRVTDIWFGSGWCYQEKQGSPEWDFAFVPAYPLDVTDGGEGETIRLIVRVSNIRGEADALELLDRDEFTAQVWNNQIIPPGCQKTLRGFYPQIDFDNCGVIRVGDPLPTLHAARNYRIGGWCVWGLAILLAGWWLADWRAVRLGVDVGRTAVDPYAWQANGGRACGVVEALSARRLVYASRKWVDRHLRCGSGRVAGTDRTRGDPERSWVRWDRSLAGWMLSRLVSPQPAAH